MSLLYYYAWDFARVGTHQVKVTDSATFEVSITSGTYAHITLVSVDTSCTDFAAALQSALNTGTAGARTYAVSWSSTTGYTITATGGNFSLSFTTTTSADAGTRMRHLLGMSGNRSGAATYSSQVRPYYFVIPAIAGRSDVSDDYEPDGIVQEAIADDGTAYDIAVSTAEKRIDWMQVGDQDSPGTAYTAFGLGTPVHKRFITNPIPWTWEHSWEHHRTGFDPILVVDGSEQVVVKLRAEGASFHPKRMGGADYDLWSVSFKTRLIGRL